MTTWTMQRLAATLLTASLIAAGVPACGDDDSDDGTPDAGGDSGSGSGGSSGKGGSGSAGKGGSGSAGKGGSGSAGKGGSTGSDDDGGVAVGIDSKAADLRVGLNLLLSEHSILAAKTTGAAIDGRAAESGAYLELLNKNGTDIGAAIKAAYNAAAETEFNRIWSAHNGFFVDYTTAVAEGNSTNKAAAVAKLTTEYVPQFTDFLNGATDIPKAALETLITDHVTQTAAIVDAQKAAKDDPTAAKWKAVYAAIKTAFGHMSMIGDALSEAITTGDEAKFPGDSTTKAVSFRTALNQLLQDHLYLASFATNAALGARAGETTEAVAALNANGTTIGGALGDIYDADAEETFNTIWSAHNGYFVDYTTGVATDDEAKKTQAVDDLTKKYVPDFRDFLNTATGLPKATLEELITDHVLTTKAIVDAQGADTRNEETVAEADRTAAQHMQMIGDPLSAAIVAKVPSKF